MLQETGESLINQAIEIYKISKGLFRPRKSDLGAKIYYMIVEKANSEVKSETSKSEQSKDNKAKLRINPSQEQHMGSMIMNQKKQKW